MWGLILLKCVLAERAEERASVQDPLSKGPQLVCSLFNSFAQLGSKLPRWHFNLPIFKFSLGKGVFWACLRGVLCTHISPKGVCDG